MVESFLGTTNGRRLALARGFCSPLCFYKGVIPMTILEVVAILGIILKAIQIGFSFGKNAKK